MIVSSFLYEKMANKKFIRKQYISLKSSSE